MTAVLSVCLLFVAPVAPKETVWSTTSVGTEFVAIAATSAPPTPRPFEEFPGTSNVLTVPLVVVEESPPPTSPSLNEAPMVVRTDGELVDELFGWPGRQLVQCESNWNRWAVGRYGERGLFQIHPIHRGLIAAMGYSWDQMFEAEPNIRVAVEIRRVQGLRAWTCWKG